MDGITRVESDTFALQSHQRAIAAIEAGRFHDEIVPVDTANGPVSVDEGPRAGTSMEKLAALKTIFRSDGIVTAGSSSPLTDGASAVLIMSETRANQLGLRPR